MKAVRIHQFGGLETLKWEDVETPQPGRGEVLLRVQAASVNPVDYKIRLGRYPVVKADQLPYVLGRDASGVVVAAGPGARAKEGDEIFAMLGMNHGGYAEFALVRAEEAAAKPGNLSFVEAASVPLAGLTAWQGLFQQGRLQPGQRVLIHGGAGGVGHLAIQFAKAKGAWVATTVSEPDVGFAHELGADQVIDYKAEMFEKEIEPVDLVYDLIGGETQSRSWAVIKSGGALISTLEEPNAERAGRSDVMARRYTAEADAAELDEIRQLIEAGQVKPTIAATFPLAEAAKAQEMLETQHVRGKVVLQRSA